MKSLNNYINEHIRGISDEEFSKYWSNTIRNNNIFMEVYEQINEKITEFKKSGNTNDILDLNDIDVSKIKDFGRNLFPKIFEDNRRYFHHEINKMPTRIDISNWNINPKAHTSFMFDGYRILKEVLLPKKLESIGARMFADCYENLEHIEIPDSVKFIGTQAFSNCKKLKSVELPDSVTYIDTSVFILCSDLEYVKFPNNITYIPSKTFASSGLKTFEIPEGVTNIGYDAFINCTELESITIPKSVNRINENAFVNCNNLKEVHISDLDAFKQIKFDDKKSNPLNNSKAKLYLNGKEVPFNIDDFDYIFKD